MHCRLPLLTQNQFFLDLWNDITKLSSQKHDLDKTSKLAIQTVTNDAAEGTVFDETNTGYKALSSRVEQTILNLLKREIQHSMKPYFRK